MRRTVTDVLRRGFVSTVANWQVIVMRVAETVIEAGVVIVAAVSIVVPLVVAAGVSSWTIPPSNNGWNAMLSIVAQHGALIAYFLVTTLIVIGILLAIHSFVMAGCARIYVDADRLAPDTAEPTRAQFTVFTFDRWFGGAREAWARIFWIYNGAWGMAGLILLVPILIILIFTILAAMSESVALSIGLSCFGIAVILIVGIPLATVTSVWTQKAIVVCVARNTSAREALRSGWAESKADFLRHLVVYIVVIVISFGVASVLSVFSPFAFGFGARSNDFLALFTAPAYVALNVVQSAATSAVACWLIGAFVAMTEERR